jgi:hypothetical protein
MYLGTAALGRYRTPSVCGHMAAKPRQPSPLIKLGTAACRHACRYRVSYLARYHASGTYTAVLAGTIYMYLGVPRYSCMYYK